MPNFSVSDHIQLQNNVWLFHLDGETVLTRAGTSITIGDADGFLHAMLKSLDGTEDVQTSYKRLPADLQKSYTFDMMLDAIQQLDAYKVFENVSRSQASEHLLSDYQRARWSRNFEFLNAFCTTGQSKYELQKRMADTKVTLLGLGGIGSHALFDLVSLGFTKITCIDFDKVDVSNLNRQILYGEKDVGRKKIEAAKESIERYIAPEHHNISFHDVFIDGWQKVLPYVEKADVVMSCVDRPAAVMEWVNEACVRANVPLVAGGVDTKRSCTYTILPGQTGCVECWRRQEGKASVRRRELMNLGLAVDVMKLPPRAAPVHLVAIEVGLMVSEVMKIVTGIVPPSAVNKLVQYDFEAMTVGPIEEWTMDPACPICGPRQAAEAA